MGPIGSAVLTFNGNKQTIRQAKFMYRYERRALDNYLTVTAGTMFIHSTCRTTAGIFRRRIFSSIISRLTIIIIILILDNIIINIIFILDILLSYHQYHLYPRYIVINILDNIIINIFILILDNIIIILIQDNIILIIILDNIIIILILNILLSAL